MNTTLNIDKLWNIPEFEWSFYLATWSLEVCCNWLCRKLATSVILRGLPLCGWVAVIPNRFHFVMIPLTVDCGIFRSEETSRLDFLHRLCPLTAPCWNSLSSWERPILSQMIVETVCMPRCLLLYTCGHGSDWNTSFNYLDGWVNTFVNVCMCMLWMPPVFTANEDICWTSVTNPSVRDSAATDAVILYQDE